MPLVIVEQEHKIERKAITSTSLRQLTCAAGRPLARKAERDAAPVSIRWLSSPVSSEQEQKAIARGPRDEKSQEVMRRRAMRWQALAACSVVSALDGCPGDPMTTSGSGGPCRESIGWWWSSPPLRSSCYKPQLNLGCYQSTRHTEPPPPRRGQVTRLCRRQTCVCAVRWRRETGRRGPNVTPLSACEALYPWAVPHDLEMQREQILRGGWSGAARWKTLCGKPHSASIALRIKRRGAHSLSSLPSKAFSGGLCDHQRTAIRTGLGHLDIVLDHWYQSPGQAPAPSQGTSHPRRRLRSSLLSTRGGDALPQFAERLSRGLGAQEREREKRGGPFVNTRRSNCATNWIGPLLDTLSIASSTGSSSSSSLLKRLCMCNSRSAVAVKPGAQAACDELTTISSRLLHNGSSHVCASERDMTPSAPMPASVSEKTAIREKSALPRWLKNGSGIRQFGEEANGGPRPFAVS